MRVLTGVLSVVLAACLVGACGSGGGGGPTVSAPTGDTRTVSARFQAIHGRSDALLTTDFHWIEPEPQTYRRRFAGIFGDCQGTVCTGVIPSHLPDLPFSLSDLEAHDEYRISDTLNGVTLSRGTSEEKDGTETLSARDFGGWLDHNAYGVLHVFRHGPSGEFVGGLTAAYSFGNSSGSRPIQGSGVWQGMMRGAEAGQLDTVQGDATVTVDFATVDVSVEFTNIFNLARGTSLPSMAWSGLALGADGRFSARSGRTASLVGTFYGPNHEEVGGVFERNDIAGAFGARRQ